MDMDQNSSLGPNLDWATLSGTRWDAIVVGAGPAGAMAALVSARLGLQTLLIDRSAFPRDKVCGGCLNVAALSELSAVGLEDLPFRLRGVHLRQFHLAAMGPEARIELPAGFAIFRHEFDSALVREAIAAGAKFMPATYAADAGLGPESRQINLRHKGQHVLIEARWIVAADGLGGGYSESLPEVRVHQWGEPYIGLSTESIIGPGYESSTIHMACHANGYVGLVKHEGEGLHVAAAMSGRWLKACHSPGAAVAKILEANNWTVPDGLASARFHGSPRLRSTRRPVNVERVFLVGDAAGYIEPFTGEGMAWALRGGREAAQYLPDAIAQTDFGMNVMGWDRTYHELIASRQRWCALTTNLLRRPALTRLGVRLLSAAPKLASPMIRAINSPWEGSSMRPVTSR
jgi:flavin-dependent dehydrogenase